MSKQNRVFLVHGRDLSLRDYVRDVLQSFRIDILTWDDAAAELNVNRRFAFPIMEHAFKSVDAVIILLTPDELVKLKTPFIHTREEYDDECKGALEDDDTDENKGNDRYVFEQARPNVIFELGYLMGRARTNQKVHVVCCHNCRWLSNIESLDFIPLKANGKRAFLMKLINCLCKDGLIKPQAKEKALKSASNIEIPPWLKYQYMTDKDKDLTHSVAAIRRHRGGKSAYWNLLVHSKQVRIIGVSQESIIRAISNALKYHEKDASVLKTIDIQISIAANIDYTHLIDRLEGQKQRQFYKNIENLLDMNETIHAAQANNLALGMHLVANSCTFILLDHLIWVTPYTHMTGGSSPTFVVSAFENPDIYQFYCEYFTRIWKDAVVLGEDETKQTLLKKVADKKAVIEIGKWEEEEKEKEKEVRL